MKHQNIKIFSSVDHLSDYFACFLKEKVCQLPDDRTFSLSVSGGSTPAIIFKYIAVNYYDKINWEKVKIFFGDERCVPPEHNDSNFKMVDENLLKNIPIPEKNIYRIFGEDDPAKEVKRYSKIIADNLPVNNNKPQFDLVMLGLGEDGHTASIFPDQFHLFYSDNNCGIATYPVNGQKRITITGKIINNAKTVVFIVTGNNKANLVYNIINENVSAGIYPASLVEPHELLWMLDMSASELLDSEIKKIWYVK